MITTSDINKEVLVRSLDGKFENVGARLSAFSENKGKVYIIQDGKMYDLDREDVKIIDRE